MLTLIKYLTPILISTALSFSSQAEEVAITIDWKKLNKEGQKLVENQPTLTDEEKTILRSEYGVETYKQCSCFDEELECRVQRLRIKVWECRHEALLKLARIEAPDSHEERLAELMEEYGVGEQPEVCSLDE